VTLRFGVLMEDTPDAARCDPIILLFLFLLARHCMAPKHHIMFVDVAVYLLTSLVTSIDRPRITEDAKPAETNVLKSGARTSAICAHRTRFIESATASRRAAVFLAYFLPGLAYNHYITTHWSGGSKEHQAGESTSPRCPQEQISPRTRIGREDGLSWCAPTRAAGIRLTLQRNAGTCFLGRVSFPPCTPDIIASRKLFKRTLPPPRIDLGRKSRAWADNDSAVSI